MHAMRLSNPGGLDNLALASLDPAAPPSITRSHSAILVRYVFK